MKTSKYEGGSKIVSFRLPIASLSLAIIEINNILKQYERTKVIKDKNSVKSTVAKAKTTFDKKPKSKPIMYKCGCNITENIFRRHEHCKIGRLNH